MYDLAVDRIKLEQETPKSIYSCNRSYYKLWCYDKIYTNTNFSIPKLAENLNHGACFLIFWLEKGQKCVFWPKTAKKWQKSHFSTSAAPQNLSKPKNSEFSDNFDIETFKVGVRTDLLNLSEPEMNCAYKRGIFGIRGFQMT